MNLYEFIQYKKLGHTERKSFTIDSRKISLMERVLIEEESFENFKINLKNFSFIVKGNDEETIDYLNKSTKTTIKKMLDYKKGFPFNYQFSSVLGVLFPYYGSKKNRRNEGNETIEYMLKNGNKINKVCDLFAGAGNLTFDNLYVFDKYNPNMKVIMNDLNVFISSTYYNIQNYKEEVFEEYSKIIFWIKNKFKSISLKNEEEFKILQKYLVEKINIQCYNKIYNSETTALFLFLQHISRSGAIDYDVETKKLTYESFRSSKEPYQLISFANIINKIFFYSEALNIMNIEITNEDYNNIIKNYKEDSLLLIDSPYTNFYKENLETGGIDYTKEEAIKEIDFGYNFDQEKLLNYIKEHKGSYILWNNHHIEIELFSMIELKDCKYNKVKADYRGSNGDKIEIWMYINYLNIKDIEDFNILDEYIEEYEYQKKSINNSEIELQEEDKEHFYQSRYNLFTYIELYTKRNERLPYQLLKYKKEYDLYMLEQPSF